MRSRLQAIAYVRLPKFLTVTIHLRASSASTGFFVAIVCEAVRCGLLGVTSGADHFGEEIGVVVDLMRHLAADIE